MLFFSGVVAIFFDVFYEKKKTLNDSTLNADF